MINMLGIYLYFNVNKHFLIKILKYLTFELPAKDLLLLFCLGVVSVVGIIWPFLITFTAEVNPPEIQTDNEK